GRRILRALLLALGPISLHARACGLTSSGGPFRSATLGRRRDLRSRALGTAGAALLVLGTFRTARSTLHGHFRSGGSCRRGRSLRLPRATRSALYSGPRTFRASRTALYRRAHLGEQRFHCGDLFVELVSLASHTIEGSAKLLSDAISYHEPTDYTN